MDKKTLITYKVSEMQIRLILDSISRVNPSNFLEDIANIIESKEKFHAETAKLIKESFTPEDMVNWIASDMLGTCGDIIKNSLIFSMKCNVSVKAALEAVLNKVTTTISSAENEQTTSE